ncbi:glycosyltransferase [Kiritimatiellaeota bacterium B1221]|nr:glycosyltransferase [Kiritimatiellaeota bacterium B1221]
MNAVEPHISVLLSVAGRGEYLAEAVSSILNQTYSSFELLIMNDGSSEELSEILNTFEDPRIKIFTSAKRQGLPSSLNTLFKASRGKLIARMDGDDISFKTRFEKQVEFLQGHPDTILVGSWVKLINLQGEETGKLQLPVRPAQICFEHYFRNPIIHPSIMVRRSALETLEGPYCEEYRFAQDYDLMIRLIHSGNCVNLPMYLLGYRKHPGQASTAKQKEQKEFHLQALETFADDFKEDKILFSQLKTYHELRGSGKPLPMQLRDVWSRVYVFLAGQGILPDTKTFLHYVGYREVLEAYRNRELSSMAFLIFQMLKRNPMGLLHIAPYYLKGKRELENLCL